MRSIKIEKVTLNIGTGESGDKLEKARKLFKTISGMKAIPTVTKKRIPAWKIRPGLAIGCKVTVRGNKAKELLRMLLKGVRNRLDESKFDDQGNFSFGIKEYLDVPGIEYDADVGVIGFDVSVTLQRPGFRIKRRMLKRKEINNRQKILKEDAIEFMKKEFNLEVIQ